MKNYFKKLLLRILALILIIPFSFYWLIIIIVFGFDKVYKSVNFIGDLIEGQ